MILSSSLLFCQTKDTVGFRIDMKRLHTIAEENAKDRHKFTVEKQDFITKNFTINSNFVLSRYKYNELELTVIPSLELIETAVINDKINILHYFKLKENVDNLSYNLYVEGKIVMDAVVEEYSGKAQDLAFYVLIGDNFDNPVRLGNDMGYMMKLGLERNHFTFYIKGLSPLFIVENGIVYAITNPTNEGGYDKMEINKYMGTMVGENNLKRILMSECLFCSLKKVTKKNKYYKKPYYFKVEKE